MILSRCLPKSYVRAMPGSSTSANQSWAALRVNKQLARQASARLLVRLCLLIVVCLLGRPALQAAGLLCFADQVAQSNTIREAADAPDDDWVDEGLMPAAVAVARPVSPSFSSDAANPNPLPPASRPVLHPPQLLAIQSVHPTTERRVTAAVCPYSPWSCEPAAMPHDQPG